jgi:bidirectional [NiFe] hydrogenase diaphorase subunit
MMAEPTTRKRLAHVVHPSGDARFKLIDRALERLQFQQDALIEVLHTAQEVFGYLDQGLLVYVARQLRLPLSWVYGVATFYHFFSLEPQGEHSCIVCMGTACYVKRSAEILAAVQHAYDVEAGETTRDGKLSVSTARCLGSCGLAPLVVLDGEVLGRQTPETTLDRVSEAMKAKAPAAAATSQEDQEDRIP